MMNLLNQVLALAILLLVSLGLCAHEQSISRITIAGENNNSNILWQVSMKDIARVINLDDNHDKNIQWSEVIGNHAKLAELLNENIRIASIEGRCSSNLIEINLIKLSAGNSLLLNAKLTCRSVITDIRYLFLANLDKLHIAQVDIKLNSYQDHFLFNKHSNFYKLIEDKQQPNDELMDNEFVKFVYQGIVHIWIGIDHLAFLLILLFSARTKRLSKGVNRRQLFSFVTAFTIAHSITLVAASMDFIRLPSWFVESIIAGSVGWGAYLVIRGRKFIDSPTVFGFGLIHGLGFASVLSDLTGMASSNILLLLGFNFGVELGQVAFLFLMYGILFIPIKHFGFQKVARLASAPILIIASVWAVERIFETEILDII